MLARTPPPGARGGYMQVRDLLLDGIDHMNTWMIEAVDELTLDQLNWVPGEGVALSAGFNAWHIFRTQDNLTNFVLQGRKPPLWLSAGFMERVGGPKIEQATGMSLEDARAIIIKDKVALIDYGRAVAAGSLAYLQTLDDAALEQTTTIRPQGEIPLWRLYREVYMTHGFMHLGEINVLRGIQGLKFRM